MLILELIQVALGLKRELFVTPTYDEWKRVFESGKQHAIIGLLYGGIEKLPHEQLPSKNLLISWFALTEQQKLQKKRFDMILAEFFALLSREDISYVVFKGLAVASKYPEPALRTLGDVDFYVPPFDFDKAVKVIEKSFCRIEEKDLVDKHFAFNWRGVRFEMHYQMETFGYKLHQQYYSRLIDEAIEHDLRSFDIDGTPVSMLREELDLIHVFKHWMGHLLGEGIGLRQTTDIAVLIKAYKEVVDVISLKKYLARIGYLRAFDAVVMLVEKYYAVAWPEYWNEHCVKRGLKPRKAISYAEMLMGDIMRNGNFGRSDYKYRKGWEKRMETTLRFFAHCIRYFKLAPKEIAYLIPKRIAISLKAH